MNADDSLTKLEPGEYMNGFNFRAWTSETGRVSGLQPIPGTVKLASPPQNPPDELQTDYVGIGQCVDEERKWIVYFNRYGLVGFNHIAVYDTINNVAYMALREDQVIGGLGWDASTYIHSSFVINGLLYWTDNVAPRRINLDAAVKLNNPSYVTSVAPYISPMNQAVISWIRRQPGLPPSFMKVTQTTPVINGSQIALEPFMFCYRYIYRDNEASTLSGRSLLCPENANFETYNRIDILLPLGEQIDQDVIQIDLVAQFVNSGDFFIINSWKKSVAADAAAITAHNTGTALTFQFYNNLAGISLDSAYTVKIADATPIKAQTIERAKNRSFMGGCTNGYDSPTATSLALTLITQNFPPGPSGSITGEWWFMTWQTFPFVGHSAYLLVTTTAVGPVPPSTFYYYTWNSSVPPYPASVNASDLTYRGSSFGQAAANIGGAPPTHISTADQGIASTILTGGGTLSAVVGKCFKTNSSYQFSVSFKDNYGRETGVVTNNNLKVIIPNTGFDALNYTPGIQWDLSNAGALTEIPIDAYYISINVTRCLRTRFFIQGRGVMIYADKDSSGNYTFTTTAYSDNLAGVAVDTSTLQSQGMAYLLAQGDLLTLYVNGAYYSMSIIDQSGKYVIGQLTNVGTLSAQIGLFEIYTPYKTQVDEPYFEVSQIFPILNPGTNSRQYSILNGIINGDVFLFKRFNNSANYITEAMNPNDKFYKIWNTDAGRPNFVDGIGQVFDQNAVCFSNPLVQGSRINGLSTFDALDKADLPLELGSISKLILTSKIQKEGTVMLAYCKSETVSLYLGEVQVAAPQGNAFLATDQNVIGTIYPLKGSFGTIHPESVRQWRGNVFSFDAYNGAVVQYSDNGLEAISAYKMRTFWRRFADKFVNMTAAQIIALGSRPFIVGGIDPFHGEYLLSIPQLEPTVPAGTLPGNIVGVPTNLFDPYDGMAKTMVYKIEKNRWVPAYNYYAESLANVSNKLYAGKLGSLYRMNDSTGGYNQFFGVQTPSVVMFPANILDHSPKQPKAINVEADLQPDVCVLMSEYPYQQITDIQPDEWNPKEGIFYQSVRRDRLDPSFTDPNQALVEGEQLIGKVMMIQLNFQPTHLFQLKYVNVIYEPLTGHKTIASK